MIRESTDKYQGHFRKKENQVFSVYTEWVELKW